MTGAHFCRAAGHSPKRLWFEGCSHPPCLLTVISSPCHSLSGSVIGSPWLMLWEQILNEAAGAHSRAVVIRPDQVMQWFLAFLPPPRPGSSLNFIFPAPQFCTHTAHFVSCLFLLFVSPDHTYIPHPTPPCLHPWSLARVPKASLDFFFLISQLSPSHRWHHLVLQIFHKSDSH